MACSAHRCCVASLVGPSTRSCHLSTAVSRAFAPRKSVANVQGCPVSVIACKSSSWNHTSGAPEVLSGGGGDSGNHNNYGCGAGGGGRSSGNGNGPPGTGGGNDGWFTDPSWPNAPRPVLFFTHATLGALALTAASAAVPPQSKASPGFGTGTSNSSSAHAPTSLGSSPKDSYLSTSAPRHGSASHSELFSATERAASLPQNSHDSSRASSPSRPRSKVMHVACRGSTLVVPLGVAGSAGSREAASKMGGASLWQRKKIVDAPIELTTGEVTTLMASRQNRVRDSVLIQ